MLSFFFLTSEEKIGLELPLNVSPDCCFFFRYGTRFMDDYQVIMTKKLGLPKYNKQLINKLLTNMAVDKVDYTNFFRTLSNIKADTNIPDEELLVPLKSVLLDIGKERKEAWTSWLKTYIHEVRLFHIFSFG